MSDFWDVWKTRGKMNMPYRRRSHSGSCKLLETIALLLVLTVMLAVVITGSSFWLTKDMQVLLWGSTIIGSLCSALVIVLKSIDRLCR